MTSRGDVDDLVRDVARAVAEADADPTAPVFIGFSGGLDSSVLLHAAVQAVHRGRLVALHVNHSLHREADAWEDRCRAVAAESGVEFAAERVHVARRGSLEAAARRARYEAFARHLAIPGSRLLLAHHRDDQAETVLLRLLQGRGLYGMPAARPLGAGTLLRPLLGHPRARLETYARATGIRWFDDPSNADLELDRNFVRHRVLPGLRARFPGVDGALLAAMTARAAEDALLVDEPEAPLGADSLPLAAFMRRGAAEQHAWLRVWLSAHGRAVPAGRAVREFLEQLRAAPDRQPRLALDRGELRRHADRVWLVPPSPRLAARYPIACPGRLQLPHGRLTVLPDPAGFECHGPLEVRFRSGGERIRVGGQRRQLKTLFHAAGVAPWLRACHPLLFDTCGLVAVPGVAMRDAEGLPGRARYRAEWHPAGPIATALTTRETG